MRTNDFLLRLLSPFFTAALSGRFRENVANEIELEIDHVLFNKCYDLACGKVAYVDDINEAVSLAAVADELQLVEVVGALEQVILKELTPDSCCHILCNPKALGLLRVIEASRILALGQFDKFAASASFVDLPEETLGGLLDDDRLTSRDEASVLEAAVRWIRSGPSERGCGILSKVRFHLMSIADLSSQPVTDAEAEFACKIISEARRMKEQQRGAAGESAPPSPAPGQAPRGGMRASWETCLQAGLLDGEDARPPPAPPAGTRFEGMTVQQGCMSDGFEYEAWQSCELLVISSGAEASGGDEQGPRQGGVPVVVDIVRVEVRKLVNGSEEVQRAPPLPFYLRRYLSTFGASRERAVGEYDPVSGLLVVAGTEPQVRACASLADVALRQMFDVRSGSGRSARVRG